MSKNVAVIICAAGSSSRFGDGRNKAFVDCKGRAVFLHSIELFADYSNVKQVLLGISEEDEELVNVKWGPNLKFFGVKTFIGGTERFDTVKNGLKLIEDGIDFVAVHDAARCCVTKEWVDACFLAAAKDGAAILASRVVPTIKKVEENIIIETVERNGLWEAQTPQVFEVGLLRKAYENLENLNKSNISDDAQLVEALGSKVRIVEADASNIKITRKSDISIAEAIIKSRPKLQVNEHGGPYAEAQW